jgi:N-methylhydantoinase B
MDGEPSIGSITAAGAAMTGDIEVVEHAVPIHVHRYELDPDSGCPGRWRGGLGCVFEFSILDHDTLMTQFGGGMKYPPKSMMGAESAYSKERVFRKQILRGKDGEPEQLELHCVRTVHAGESVEIYCPGGGGVGLAFERDRAAVVEDVRNGVVTSERARAEYGVIIDPVTGAVDEAATNQLRYA